jgi:ribose 5-phosphate isomerase B
MNIALAVDHAGFPLKDDVKDYLTTLGHSVIDLGTNSTVSVDYPDYAQKLGQTILNGQAERGILICGSGAGVSIAANKIKGIYAAVCHDTYSAHQGVEHDNMNVLCIGARVIGPDLTKELVKAFVSARFCSEVERHVRRVKKIYELEKIG